MVTRAEAIASVNPVAIASAWILTHPAVVAAFAAHPATDGSGSTDVRIAGVVRPPYPMLRIVKTPGGSLNDARWRINPEVQIEAWGDTSGAPGPAALEQIAVAALVCLKDLEDKTYMVWEPVVTHVDVGDPFPLGDPTGQDRWSGTATLTCHPALAHGAAPPGPDDVQGG